MVYSKYKKILVYFFILPMIILLVLLGLCSVYINSENFQTKIKTILTTQLENSLNKRIEIGTIDSITFQSLGLNYFVVFEDDSNKKDAILFQAEQVKARFTLFLSLFHWKNWHLSIRDITFYQASATLTRELNGEFDFVKKLNLDPEKIQQNLFIHRIHFQNSNLNFHDKQVYHYDLEYLTTQAKNINGYFDLSQLPKVILDFQGIQEKDQALLALGGYFFIDQPEYSLDFTFGNADITHFQYYLEASKQFQVSQGKFDLDLNISFSPGSDPAEIFWQGNATFQQTDAKPDFLKQIPFNKISGSVQFKKPEIKIIEMNGLYDEKTTSLKGLILTEPKVFFDLDIESEGVNSTQLKNDIALYIPSYTEFSLLGELDLSGKVKGNPENYQIEGKISSPEIVIESISFKKSNCSFLLHDNSLIIHLLNTNEAESSLTMNGQIEWPDSIPNYHLTLQTKNLDTQHPILKQFSFLEDISGNIDSQFQIESQKQDSSVLDIEGQLTINSLKIKEFSIFEPLQGNIKAKFNDPNNLLSIDQCELKSGQKGGFIEGEVNLNEPIQLSLDFGCHLPELNEFTNSLGLATKLAGKADMKGKINANSEQQEIKANFHLQEFSIQDYFLGEMAGDLIYQENTFTLNQIHLINQDTKLTGTGKISLNESMPPEIELSYQFSEIAIDSILQKITKTVPLSGQITGGIGQIHGIWPELSIRGTFQLEEITYYNYLLGQGKLDFNLEPERNVTDKAKNSNLIKEDSLLGRSYSLKIENFLLKNESMQLTTTGQFKIQEDYPFSLEIVFSHHHFKEMIENFYTYDSFYKMFLPSEVNGKASLVGNHSEQQISLTAQLVPQQKENNPPSQLESVLIKNDQGFIISDFRLIQSEGYLEAEGKINPTQDLDIHFQAKQLDMNSLMGLVQFEEMIRGILDIEGYCKGTIKQPQISMNAQIKKGYFRDFEFDNLQSDLFWNSQTNEIEIRKLDIALEENYQIQAKGNLPIDTFINRTQEEVDPNMIYQKMPINFQITMEKADLKVLKLFWKDAFSEIIGNIDLELNLTGTTGNPLVNGNAEIHQGKITFQNYPIRFENLNTKIELSDNQMMIPEIPIIAYDNHFNLSGQLILNHFLPEKMSILLKNDQNKILYQNILETESILLADITGSMMNPHLHGQLLLKDGFLNLNYLLNLEQGNKMTYDFPSSVSDMTSRQLDFTIEINDPFKLKMVNAEIEISGKINLTGSLAEPSVQGSLILKKGYFLYFEKRFTLSDGLVTINGFTPDNININAKANTTVQDVKIEISLLGNLSNPQILLSSQPSLKETEILSLLTFGRNIHSLSEGEIDQLLSQEMMNIVFQSLQINLFKRMERELAEGLGLEFIRLSFDNSNSSNHNLFFLEDLTLEDLSLEIGKNISDDLLITYSTPLNFHGETTLGIDYQITPGFKLNTQFETFSIKEEDYQFKFGLEIRF